ncbi:threonine-phosphate decarboxylase [Mesorhizobium sp. NBSH29]|uniref:threonine-phosphate decarboxylase CobD n=1 Tax=Mesorhizobium sp. NBSH29 TaxID=2654249 RepID=UPI0018968D6E|nr:threonine-phosphate decarboxylase CobD [Mesorhizobium sp. NBSH29]QPC86639.1 threonine-phosphate decarboxylase [Mesorhizobium sp. NBSH29]
MGTVKNDRRTVIDHGGSLDRAEALFPDAPRPIVDLSTGINPHPYPLFELPATAFARLPEPSRARALAAIAARAYGAPSPAHIVPAPGTQILLPLVASLVPASRATVLGPTYAEHKRAAALAGHEVATVTDIGALADADLAIVVNPNNPDGRVTTRTDLLELADQMAARSRLLVVDEAFMDVGPEQESVAGDAGHPALIVLKSFGKFFGLAGVRLGFAIGAPETIARIEALLGPWAVAGPALEIGLHALADTGWQETMRTRLASEAARLDALLQAHGVAVAGGTNLFRFVQVDEAQALFVTLGQHGIFVRNFDWRSDVLRFGLPGNEVEWQRLAEALDNWTGRPKT